MKTLEDVLLKNYTTMRIGGPAKSIVEINTVEDMVKICRRLHEESSPLFVLGGGSNMVVSDAGFNGTVLLNRIPGFEIIADDAVSTTIRVGSGESWDDVVMRTVDMGLSGIEALSAIPGTAGAAPVQNIGAYGQELVDTLISVDAFDTKKDTLVSLQKSECNLSYRSSIFRTTDFGRYVITSVTLRLQKTPPQPPYYKAIQDYIDLHNITNVTSKTLRDIVIDIRTYKLPNPKLHPNAGSFFKNPIIEAVQANLLQKEYDAMPCYKLQDGRYKIPAGWLIEQTGLKGRTFYGMKVHDKNSLVLINESASSYTDLSCAREKIVSAVQEKFGITLEQEPIEI